MRGDGRVFLPRNSSVYMLSIYVDGKEIRETTGARDEESALKVLHKRRKQKNANEETGCGFITPSMKKVTVNELLDALKSSFQLDGKDSPQNVSTIARAKEVFGTDEIGGESVPIRALSFTNKKHVVPKIEKMLAEGYRPATINRLTGMVAQAFKVAIQEGRLAIKEPPFIKTLSELGNVRKGFVEKPALLRVVENLPKDDEGLRDMVLFAFHTGWRRGELVSLKWSDVAEENGQVLIRLAAENSKNRESRVIPIDGDLAPIIARRREARAVTKEGHTILSQHVFHRDGQEIGDFRKVWAKATKAAGVPRLIFHDLRRSAVSAMVACGVPQLTAMGLSGHKTASMFSRYKISMVEEQKNALAALAAHHAARVAEAEAKAKEQGKVVAIGQA